LSIIYTPKGKAREYSPLAANFYEGCDHGCKYCYAPGIRRATRETYRNNVRPRRDILHEIEKDCKQYAYSNQQVLFNFMGDPYCKANNENKITRGALALMLDSHIPVAILTKGGNRALQDLDIIKRFENHIKLGATLTFYDEKKSKEWEPGAAIPAERLDMLRQFHAAGIKTWASFEPVVEPNESLKLIDASIKYVDEYKIGKLNNYGGIDKTIDWKDFLLKVVKKLRDAEKPFYIKYDLRQAAPSVKLYGNEVCPDEFGVAPWYKDNP
jgi:DNA repair photolyase